MTTGVDGSWVIARSGLGHARERLRHGNRPIAYLGVSVTAQRDGFRPRLHDQLVSRFGARPAVNAGIGAVGSLACVFLMDDFVLPSRPALCFVECTTGDLGGATAVDEIGPALEGILLKLRDIDCSACLLHLYRRDCSFREPHPVVEAYERVAERYGVPSINLARHVEEQASLGRLDVRAHYRDLVHTTPEGSQFVADHVASVVDDLIAVPAARGGEVSHRPGPPARYHATAIVPADADASNAPFLGATRFGHRYRYAEVPVGASLSFRSGTLALRGLFVILGPHSGRLEVTDGNRVLTVDTRDAWCTYDRLSVVLFPVEFPPGVEIQVRPIMAGDASAVETRVKLIGWLGRRVDVAAPASPFDREG